MAWIPGGSGWFAVCFDGGSALIVGLMRIPWSVFSSLIALGYAPTGRGLNATDKATGALCSENREAPIRGECALFVGVFAGLCLQGGEFGFEGVDAVGRSWI